MASPGRITYFASTDSRGKRVPFGIKQEDRRRHMYVIGKTGMGKSTLLENLAIQDINNGEGLAFIDPHGQTAEKLLEYVPEHRVKDVVYFAPFDLEHPIAFNVMEDVGYDKRHLVTSGLMATFKKIWQDAWSARMEYILTNTLLALLEYPGATLLGVNRMYIDKEYRKKVVENIKDPVVKDFWTKEFAGYTDRFTQEATPAIQNKVGQFTSNPLIRNIIGQSESSFDIRKLMDERKILIINLSKGLVGDVNMRLLGSMLTTRIFLAAMSRAEKTESEIKALPDFYFYVDEFQNFANDTFAEILSEARKYRLNLTIAHQYVEQMEEQVRAAVFGNVGTTVAFRVGPFDAEVLETIFTPEFTKEDLVNLGFAQIYLTLMIDGVGSRPFSALTIPPIEAPARHFKKEVIDSSRTTFAIKRQVIETAIFDELASIPAPEPPPPPFKRGPKKPVAGSGAPQQKPKKEPSAPPATDRESLRAALAKLAEKAEPKKPDPSPSLKEALGAVIQQPQPQQQSQPQPKPKQEHKPEQKQPEQKQEQKPQQRQEQPQPKPPFEVPEEALRAVFKEDA
ncbi:MAG TPA: type IV secretory system conjugative DNA transfer family protein [Candidatus Paceibacterota bacterium]|nr:type IV secretory system conjugative DNA transfer family protein [Candidatus Paceibacterota bacterium]